MGIETMVDVQGFHIDSKTGIFTADGATIRNKEPAEYLKFLMTHRGRLNIFPHLDASFACLCKLLDLSLRQLNTLHAETELIIGDYILKSFGGVFCAVEYVHKSGWANFMSASQYDESLSTQEDKRFPSYCIERAKKAQAIGRKFKEGLGAWGWKDTSMSPKASLEAITKLDEPDIGRIPVDVLKWAHASSRGGWVEAFTIGHWDEDHPISDYDKNKAYPSVARNLLHLDYGDWVHDTEEPEGAVYGWCMARVRIRSEFSPILWWNKGEEQRFTPYGNWERPINKQDLDFIDWSEIGDYKISEGHWWVPRERNFPYRKLIDSIVGSTMMENARGIEKQIGKMGLNGYVYGRLLQFDDKADAYKPTYNPLYADLMVGGTRLDIAATKFETGVTPAHISIDGLVRESEMPTPSSDEIGGWRLEYTGPCIIAGSSCVGKDVQKDAVFALTYDKLKAMIEDDLDARSWSMQKPHIITLEEAIQKKDRRIVGKMTTITRTVSLAEVKRSYGEFPKNGRELLSGKKYHSKPQTVEALQHHIKDNVDIDTREDGEWWQDCHPNFEKGAIYDE